MNKNEVLLRKARKVLVSNFDNHDGNANDPRVMTLQAELMRLGFMMDQHLCCNLSLLEDKHFNQLFRQVVATCKSLVGDDVQYTPMYPNFPSQVMEMDEAELYLNAIMHYWTFGAWKPDYQRDPRLPSFELINYKMLTAGTSGDYIDIVRGILASNASVTDTDREIVVSALSNLDADAVCLIIPKEIPFKENLCWFVSECYQRDRMDIGILALKTPTDILRFVSSLSGGDVSLATNTKFKSFSRDLRRRLIAHLESVVNDDDLFRHRNKWIRLAHSLHVGDYSSSYPRAYDAIQRLRDRNYKYVSFEGRVDVLMNELKPFNLINLLSQRPGIFARRLDHILRSFPKYSYNIINGFLEVAHKVDTRVLLQLYGHFNSRVEPHERLVFPKGVSSNVAVLLKDRLDPMDSETVDRLMNGIQTTLESRFSILPTLGKVYVDETLKGCPIPLSLRSASEGLQTVARGTRLPLGDKDTLRMFIYWVGQDIDLSASLLDDNFDHHTHLSYYNLKDSMGCHSGDITRAPRGASEFIDINIPKARSLGARYLAMQVYVFYGPTFVEHDVCYAGWMMRAKPKSNEIYDPKTVEQRISLTAKGKSAVPVLFDLETREAIWLDVSTGSSRTFFGGNNSLSNHAQVTDIIRGAVDLANKPTLYDLFVMHANARCEEYVCDPSEADTIFSMKEGVTPHDTTTILSEYL